MILSLLCLGVLAAASPEGSSAPLPTLEFIHHPIDEVEKLKAKLTAKDDRDRQEAVKSLIGLDSLNAWDLVLDSLSDPVGRVADEAQLGLPRIHEELHKELFGKRGLQSKREIVALRVAEALGRMDHDFGEKRYLKALGHKDSDVRRSLLWSLERLAKRGVIQQAPKRLVEKLSKMARKDKVDAVKAQAILALAVIDKEAAALLAGGLGESKALEVRVAAMELTHLVPEEFRTFFLTAGTADKVLSVRLAAYEAAAGLGTLRALAVLINALEDEPRARATWRIVDLLRSTTGMKHGRDPRPWKAWLEQQPEDWSPSEKGARSELGESGTSALVGMRVISSHLAILVDFSGSMWEKRGSETRRERVDVEMRKALEGMRPDTQFNIQPYATESLLWQKKLVPASKANVSKAVKYFESCKLQGKGDFWSAMRLAMKDPKVDTLMVLGDGAPSGGPRWNLLLMKELFAHENRFRRIALDALLVDCSGYLTSQWEVMTAESGGRCLGVNF